ncbi:entericidin EcnAB [Vibrio sp. VB16]|nr:entericidin EcnAB [Vibrio sp. VB16]UGA55697.1 entericidin EcnAB [Vibrio sp. VB16]
MKASLIAIVITFFLIGCSNTWDGVKEDSSTIWNDTKETIHEATE